MKSSYFRIGKIVFSAAIGMVAFIYALLAACTYWIFYCYGHVSLWLILAHCRESPEYLPPGAILSISVSLCLCLVVGLSVAVLTSRMFDLLKKLFSRFGEIITVTCSILLCVLIGRELIHWGDVAFNLRLSLQNALGSTHLFSDSAKVVSPRDITIPVRKNLIVIVSESLEQGFAEGLECDQNIIPDLFDWQLRNYRFLNQKQIVGTDYTAGSLMSMFYGIPRIVYITMCLDDLNGDYPRLTIPSIWDVFLDKGYNCLYCQGGDFNFASKKNLFPTHERMRLIGKTDLENSPEYVNLQNKPLYGIQDELTIRRFKRELSDLAFDGKPFFAVLLTLDTHGPYGWCSPSAENRFKSSVANSVFEQGRLLADLLDWLTRQPYYSDSSVVVLGDHLYWYYNTREVPDDRVVYNAVKPYNGFTGFGMPSGSVRRHEAFVAFDWAPTFLELAGARLKDRQFGLGTSLFSESPTLAEQIGIAELERKLQGSANDFNRVCLRPQKEN